MPPAPRPTPQPRGRRGAPRARRGKRVRVARGAPSTRGPGKRGGKTTRARRTIGQPREAPADRAVKERGRKLAVARRVRKAQRAIVAANPGVTGPTPRRRFKPGPAPAAPKVVVITSFKARGSVENRFRKSPGGLVRKERARDAYFELQSEAPPGFPNAPGVWASNESLFLGQVNFPGRVSRKMLFEMLNVALGLMKPNGRIADFRRVYKRYEWKYQIFVKIGEAKRIVERAFGNDRNGR